MTQNTQDPQHFSDIGRIVLLFSLVWVGLVGYFSISGILETLNVYIVPIVIVVMTIMLVASYFVLPSFHAWVNNHGLFRFTAFHIWRVGAAGIFFWYDAQDLLPDSFVDNAAWGSLVVGLFATATVMVPMSVKHYRFFHIVGLLDLIIVIATGVALTIMGELSMASLLTFPVALIPLFGVPVSLATHTIAFHMMRKG